jgi:hypothetical protein
MRRHHIPGASIRRLSFRLCDEQSQLNRNCEGDKLYPLLCVALSLGFLFMRSDRPIQASFLVTSTALAFGAGGFAGGDAGSFLTAGSMARFS